MSAPGVCWVVRVSVVGEAGSRGPRLRLQSRVTARRAVILGAGGAVIRAANEPSRSLTEPSPYLHHFEKFMGLCFQL